jgi:hypothetical protein
MEHDDARDPQRRPEDGEPLPEAVEPRPNSDESMPAPSAGADETAAMESASVADAPAELPPDAPIEPRFDATADVPPETDFGGVASGAAGADETPAQTWPEADLDTHDEPAAEETWPERVEPEAPSAAWPATDTATADMSTEHAETYREPPPSEAEAFDAAEAAGAVGAAGVADAAAATAAHAVPATNVSESTRCPRCGTENRPGLAFCSNCGQRLVAAGASATLERPGTPEGTQACPRCGTHNRAGVAFCQNCGANLRATTAPPGYVPPAVGTDDQVAASATTTDEARGGAILGPIVLLIAAIGIAVGWLLPFAFGAGSSLYDRAFGAGGYGAAFWNGYPDVTGGLAEQAYFGFAGPSPLFVALLVVLAVAGFLRAAPGTLQRVGLGLALIWALGLVILFLIVEVFGSWNGDIVGLLRELSPGGIIFFLASLIALIGTLTRFARS